MGTCDEILELISAALDGELTAEEQAQLDAHLAGCPACSALFDDLRTVHAEMADLPELAAPEGFTARVMDAVAAEGKPEQASNVTEFPAKRRARGIWKRWGAAAAAVAVVALSATTLYGEFGKSASTADAPSPMSMDSSTYITSNESAALAESDSDAQAREAVPSYGASAADGTAADSAPYMDDFAFKSADRAEAFCALLRVSSADAPAELEDYEVFSDGGTLCYILPAQELYTLAQELELTAEELEPDAEYGLVIVEFTES